MVPGGTMSPRPRLTAFMTLSGWSPNTGMPTIGTPWNAACARHAQATSGALIPKCLFHGHQGSSETMAWHICRACASSVTC